MTLRTRVISLGIGFRPRSSAMPSGCITSSVLSLRDVELILAERGIVVTHESIRHWCLKFGTDFARKLRRRRPQPGRHLAS